MVISIDAGKAFGKVWHPFIIRTQRKLGIEGNIIKSIYEEAISQHHIECFLHKISRISTVTPLLNIVLEALANSISV